jgi:hypothetical protein
VQVGWIMRQQTETAGNSFKLSSYPSVPPIHAATPGDWVLKKGCLASPPDKQGRFIAVILGKIGAKFLKI